MGDGADFGESDTFLENGGRRSEILTGRRMCCKQLAKGIAAFVTFVAGIATIYMAWWPSNDSDHGDSEKTFVASTVAAGNRDGRTQYSAGNAESSTPLASDVGCYREDDRVDCVLSHDREVFDPAEDGGCDRNSLVLFLGGHPGVDVLNGQLMIAEAGPDTSLCAVMSADGEQLEGTLEGVWATDSDGDGYQDGGEYRPCLNSQGLASSCSEPHQTEIFYAGDSAVDCRVQYEEFSGRGFASDSGSVRVVSGKRDGAPACWLEVLAQSDQLTASVRGLEDTALPIAR